MPHKNIQTFEELRSWMDDAFECVRGSPRAYMEFPVKTPGDTWFINRERYVVLSLAAPGPRKEWERSLCMTMLATLRLARMIALSELGVSAQDAFFEGSRPIAFIRTPLEFHDEGSTCKVYFRLTIPGVDLYEIFGSRRDGEPAVMLTEAHYE